MGFGDDYGTMKEISRHSGQILTRTGRGESGGPETPLPSLTYSELLVVFYLFLGGAIAAGVKPKIAWSGTAFGDVQSFSETSPTNETRGVLNNQ